MTLSAMPIMLLATITPFSLSTLVVLCASYYLANKFKNEKEAGKIYAERFTFPALIGFTHILTVLMYWTMGSGEFSGHTESLSITEFIIFSIPPLAGLIFCVYCLKMQNMLFRTHQLKYLFECGHLPVTMTVLERTRAFAKKEGFPGFDDYINRILQNPEIGEVRQGHMWYFLMHNEDAINPETPPPSFDKNKVN